MGALSMERPRTFSQVLKGLRTIAKEGIWNTSNTGSGHLALGPNPMPALKSAITLVCGVNGALSVT